MMFESEYLVSGMTCGHCEMSVREELEQVSGVKKIDVSAKTGRLLVSSDRPLEKNAVLAAVAEAGYTAEAIR